MTEEIKDKSTDLSVTESGQIPSDKFLLQNAYTDQRHTWEAE